MTSFQRTATSVVEVFSFAYILEEAGVAIVPGEAFEMPGFVRLTYCKSMDYLAEAMEAMKKAMAKL